MGKTFKINHHKLNISGHFKMDGISMPDPSTYEVDPKPMSADSHRLIETGELVAPYVSMQYTITWKYNFLDNQEYQLLYNQYVLQSIQNKSLYHTLKTLDSNTGEEKEFDIYLQSDFKAPLYFIDPETKERYYKDVIFTFVTRKDPDLS